MENLNNAFKEMRKEGLIARQNFLCCGNCAGYAITGLAEKAVKAGKKFTGVVYYHAQDNDRKKRGQDFNLGYGAVDSNEMGKLGLGTLKVGHLVCDTLKKHGVIYEWDGKPETTVLIKCKETERNNEEMKNQAEKEQKLKEFTERRNQAEKERKELKNKLEKKYGVKGYDKADRVFELAWEHGHSSGEQDIEFYYADFVALIK